VNKGLQGDLFDLGKISLLHLELVEQIYIHYMQVTGKDPDPGKIEGGRRRG